MSWPLLVYFIFVIVLVAAVLAVSYGLACTPRRCSISSER